MKRLLPLLALAAAGLTALACTTSQGSLLAEGPPAVEQSEEPVQAAEEQEQWQQAYYEEKASNARRGLEIDSDPDGAEVYLDNRYVGVTPILLTEIPQGRYHLTLTKDGYYPSSAWISHFSERSVYSLTLTRITGFLRVEVQPIDALVTVGSESYEPGRVSELPVGRYTLRARSFGYEEHRESVVIRERVLTEVSVTLADASFRVGDLRVSRERFNPANPGALGGVTIGFEVSSFGTAAVAILDQEGREVHQASLPRFDTWHQEITWDGRLPGGQAAPDGWYTIVLRAVGEQGQPQIERRARVRVDSSLILAFRSLFSGGAGLMYAPTPEALPGGSFQLSTLVMAHWEQAAGETLVRVPVAFAGRWGIAGRAAGDDGTAPFERWELDVQAGSVVGYAGPTGEESFVFPFFASAALRTTLLAPSSRLGFRGALQAKLAYQGVPTDTLANSTGFSLGLPSAFEIGPVALLLTPELILSPWRVSYEAGASREAGFFPWLYARGGVLVDLGVVTAGLSASLRSTPFTEGFALDLPFQAAVELHWLVPNSSLFLSFAFAGEFSPPEGYYLQGGAGLGLVH